MLQVVPISIERRPLVHEVSPAPKPQATIADRLQRLELDAWEVLYLEHQRLIRGVLAGHLGYSAELDDIVQQVFETALRLVNAGKVHLIGESSSMRAWLVAIALRLVRTERRRQFKAKLTSDPLEASTQTSEPLDPTSIQLLQRAHRVLLRLPDRLRSPWLLRHLERMSLEEVAASTGVSLATVKRRLVAADERFQKLAERDPVLREHLQQRGTT